MNLGFAPSVHRRAAKAARNQFFKASKAAKAAAARGSCSKAVQELVATAAWHGVAAAEYLDSGPRRGAHNVGPTKKHLIATRKAVLRACGCSKRRK